MALLYFIILLWCFDFTSARLFKYNLITLAFRKVPRGTSIVRI